MNKSFIYTLVILLGLEILAIIIHFSFQSEPQSEPKNWIVGTWVCDMGQLGISEITFNGDEKSGTYSHTQRGCLGINNGMPVTTKGEYIFDGKKIILTNTGMHIPVEGKNLYAGDDYDCVYKKSE